MNKFFLVMPGAGNGIYQPRVCVNREHEYTDVGEKLSSFCMWGGVDKRGDEWISYECRPERLVEARLLLLQQGFVVTDKLLELTY